MNGGRLKVLPALLAVALLWLAGAPAYAQEPGTIQGSVVDAATSRPLAGAQVYIPGTQIGTVTNTQGRFLILNVPAGSHTLEVRMIGYADLSRDVTVAAGQTVNQTFQLTQTVIALQEVVVTGVAGETQRAKLPFVVDQLRTDQLPVPAVSAGTMIQGKVAGATVVAGSGRPGSGQSILLRGPTSINASGRNQEPLYIVDNVILGSSFVDFDALEIENIEIVKGAAAASLYGSRAANGVVHITTRRGADLAEGQSRFTMRSEIGRNQLPKTIETAKYHPYAMNSAGTMFVDENGNEFGYFDEGDLFYTNWESFQANEWPGQTYDNLDAFFEPGTFGQHSISMSGRYGQTNYLASFSNTNESGVMPGHEGFERNSFRLNLDHGLFDNMKVHATAYYSRSRADQIAENQTSPLFTLTMLPPIINVGERDAQGRLNPWPGGDRGEELNPLYVVEQRRFFDRRDRFLGSGTLMYSPTSWFTAEAGLSYDRMGLDRENFYPKGYSDNWDGTPGVRPSNRTGSLRLDNFLEDALSAHATANFTRRFGDLATRTSVRYLYEEQNSESFFASGSNFSVDGIPRLGVTQSSGRGIGSSAQTVKSEGVFLSTYLDFRDRYILDGQVRRDGSSLFGPEERWHTYYRLAGAWRVSEEDFFNIDGVNEFKLRYAYGTAGSKPSFAAQYEVYSVSGGAPSPVTLGNRDLKPEFAREQEMGFDLYFLDRFDFTATYASSNIDDQILSVPLAAYAGFGNQWRNAGSLKSNTIELSLGGDLYRGDRFSWSSRVLFDRTRQEITSLDVPCHTYGLPTSNPQGFEAAFYACEGEPIGAFYGIRWAEGYNDLPAGTDQSHFDINDDGYVVYVGQGNSWRDGQAKDLWGTSGVVDGISYQWGAPVQMLNDEGFASLRIGEAMPDFNWSFSNTFRFGGLSVYSLIDASHGFSVYNKGRQWAIRDRMSADMDQPGKPEDEWKPIGYYVALYAVNNLNSEFVEDGSFVKLRELSLRYDFANNALSRIGLGGVDRLALMVTGRNLLTFTDYTGYDPEVGFGGGTAGSAALNRIDAYQYPNYRTFSVGVEIGF